MGNEEENIYWPRGLWWLWCCDEEGWWLFLPMEKLFTEKSMFSPTRPATRKESDTFNSGSVRLIRTLWLWCDRVLVGIRDKGLSLQASVDGGPHTGMDHTDRQAVTRGLQGHAIRSVQEVRNKHRDISWKPQQGGHSMWRTDKRKKENEQRCGKTKHHKDEKCPAAKGICHSWHMIGH